MENKNRLKKIIYINAMFFISFLVGCVLGIIILVNDDNVIKDVGKDIGKALAIQKAESIELEIINKVCAPMILAPLIGWIVECLALFGISIKTKYGKISIKKNKLKNKKDKE